MKQAAHIITGIQMASTAIKISAPKKDMSTQRRMEIKEAEWETTFEHTKCSFSCSAVSLALSQAVIILHGAPCYAISAVKHQRKWIIENMIFWSGVVKEPFPSCCCEPCSTLICGQPQPQPEPESQTPHQHATLLHTRAPSHSDTPSDLWNSSICLTPLHFDRADTVF